MVGIILSGQFFVIAVVIFAVLISFFFWRKATIALMYWILLVGAVRKWLFPQFADVIFFSSHVILTGIYLRFFIGGYRVRYLKPFVLFLMILLISWSVLSLFNPRLPDLKIGILGLVIHFYFTPLAFIVPRVFRTQRELMDFLKKYSLFSIPLLLLGIVQYFSPADSEINRYVSETMSIAMVSGYPRITSTFSYLSGYATYLNVLFMILLYLISAKKIPQLWKVLYSILIVLTAINLFMTGSRGAIGISIISALIYLAILTRLGAPFLGKVSTKLMIISGVFLLLVNSTYVAKESFEAFMERVYGSTDVTQRLIDNFTPFKYLDKAGFLGYGIGTTYQGAERFEVKWGDMPREFEEEPERILLELGLVGYLLVYLLRLVILIYFWELFKKLTHVDLKLMALCSLLFQLQFLHFNSLVFNLTSGIFYWFFVGFLFLLPKLDRRGILVRKAESSYLPSQ
jgi:hypothetical protein